MYKMLSVVEIPGNCRVNIVRNWSTIKADSSSMHIENIAKNLKRYFLVTSVKESVFEYLKNQNYYQVFGVSVPMSYIGRNEKDTFSCFGLYLNHNCNDFIGLTREQILKKVKEEDFDSLKKDYYSPARYAFGVINVTSDTDIVTCSSLLKSRKYQNSLGRTKIKEKLL